jgi:hypothetical protein
MPYKIAAYSLTEDQAAYVREVMLLNFSLNANGYLNTLCWNWTGGMIKHGYGHFPKRTAGTRRIHRLSYMAFTVRFQPTNHLSLHECHRRGCIRPIHLLAES